MPQTATAWVLEAPGKPLVRQTLTLASPGPSDVIVEVEACGLCHTDLGFARGSVAPRHALPLVLGHEITGTVRDAGERKREWLGKRVLVPSVIPCGDCAFCRAERGNACLAQKMPGNDIHGGFATHVSVPAAQLVSLEDVPSHMATDALSVVADAVSTAYQAVRRSELADRDVAFVIGAGGVGGFTAQTARAFGARVIACDVSDARLAQLEALGIDRVVNVDGRDSRDVKKQLHAIAKEWGIPSLRFRIFECSGTTAGQTLAFALLANAATLVIVGYTRESVTVRLSNLMAFDATVHGSWGCPIEAYPAVLSSIYAGNVVLEPFIERAPMSEINEHLRALEEHRLSRRLVLDPRA